MPHSSEKLTRLLVSSLWANWAISAGAVSMVLFVALFIPKLWMPVPVFILAYLELVYLRNVQSREGAKCTPMLRASVLALFWIGFVMLTINILNSRMLFDDYINWSNSNRDVPFVTSLVVFPVMMLSCLWVMLRGSFRNTDLGIKVNRDTVRSDGGVIAALYDREGHYQLQMLLFLAIGMCAVEWWYYFQYYININLNTPDRFFFNYMPLAMYGISLFFVWSRYQNLAAVIGPIAATERHKGVMMRYLVLKGDTLLLAMNEYDRWDTPAITYIGHLDTKDDNRIHEAFSKITGCDRFDTRMLYETFGEDNRPEIAHCAVFMEDDSCLSEWGFSNWFTLDQIDRLLKGAQLSAELSDEIYRIFTITMAWKTYDREGKRLYPIKHYRPTFRLRDLKDWTVDYGDTSWFNVAENNQDRPFFRTRKLWRKITGSKI